MQAYYRGQPGLAKAKRILPESAIGSGVVVIDGTTYPLKGWNSNGFIAETYTGELRKGNHFEITASLTLFDNVIDFSCDAIVVRTDPDQHELEASFTAMDINTRRAIAQIFDADQEQIAYRVLLIEDDEDDYIITRDLLADIKDCTYQLHWCSTYDAGLKALEGKPDICLVDYYVGGRTGLGHRPIKRIPFLAVM